MDVNRQKECKDFEPNTKGYCIYGVGEGYHIDCGLHPVCRCPFAWKWKDLKSCQRDWD